MEGQDGEKEAGVRSQQVGSGDGTGGPVRTPGAAGRGSGVPGPLTVIAERGRPGRAQAQSLGRRGTRLRNRASAAPPRSASEAEAEKGRGQGESAPVGGALIRAADPSPSPPGPAGGARRRTERKDGWGAGAGRRPDRGRSARGRRSSGPRAAGYRGPGLGADPDPCRRGESIRMLAPAARLLLQPVGYRALESRRKLGTPLSTDQCRIRK